MVFSLPINRQPESTARAGKTGSLKALSVQEKTGNLKALSVQEKNRQPEKFWFHDFVISLLFALRITDFTA